MATGVPRRRRRVADRRRRRRPEATHASRSAGRRGRARGSRSRVNGEPVATRACPRRVRRAAPHVDDAATPSSSRCRRRSRSFATPDNPRRAAITVGTARARRRPRARDRRQPGDQGAVTGEAARASSRPCSSTEQAGDRVGEADRSTARARSAPVGVGRDRDVDLVPFYRLHRRTYTTYWDLLTPAEFDERAGRAGGRARAAAHARGARPSPSCSPARCSPSATPTMQGEDTSVVRTDGRAGPARLEVVLLRRARGRDAAGRARRHLLPRQPPPARVPGARRRPARRAGVIRREQRGARSSTSSTRCRPTLVQRQDRR